MALKLDKKKSYDRLEWESINKCLTDLGFSDRWVNWIINCITTTSFKLNINGRTGNSVQPEQGTRLGDPLSPYIFIICVEYLGRYIRFLSTQARCGICIKLTRNSPGIPYLIFVDDYIIFFEATKHAHKYILNYYCKVPSELVNYNKSKFQFLKGIHKVEKKKLQEPSNNHNHQHWHIRVVKILIKEDPNRI